MSVSAKWYVMVTSASKQSVFAMMGPYPTEADAVQAADTARLPHYHVTLSGSNLNIAPPSVAAFRPASADGSSR